MIDLSQFIKHNSFLCHIMTGLWTVGLHTTPEGVLWYPAPRSFKVQHIPQMAPSDWDPVKSGRTIFSFFRGAEPIIPGHYGTPYPRRVALGLWLCFGRWRVSKVTSTWMAGAKISPPACPLPVDHSGAICSPAEWRLAIHQSRTSSSIAPCVPFWCSHIHCRSCRGQHGYSTGLGRQRLSAVHWLSFFRPIWSGLRTADWNSQQHLQSPRCFGPKSSLANTCHPLTGITRYYALFTKI